MTLDDLRQLCASGAAPAVEIHALTPMMYVLFHVQDGQRTPLRDGQGSLRFTSRYAAQAALKEAGLHQATFIHASAYDEMVGLGPAAASNEFRETVILGGT
ncbi:MAG: hypothetical protein CMD39_10490 [Gammaproteobacteria bacterium]|nr:hypothetical protein [Gammaproteobacteria bacterium]|tara:strand:- start:10188 stop:10490 length:303 start_codon:yes stop_codon:yes gene_type:complete